MAGLTQARQQAVLDTEFPTSGSTHHVAYSTDGSSETGILDRTEIGATGWAAATAATPSVKANNTGLTSAQASGGGTITHFAVFDSGSGGEQLTDWEPLDASRTVEADDQLTWAVGALEVTLD